MNDFPKGERLKSRKKILSLLHNGNIAKAGPVKIIWEKDSFPDNDDSSRHIQAAFSVPKRKFKKAVQRNRIRRKMKEIFRLNKQPLSEYLEMHQLRINILIIYLSNQDLPYKQIEKHFLRTLTSILESLKFENVKKYK